MRRFLLVMGGVLVAVALLVGVSGLEHPQPGQARGAVGVAAAVPQGSIRSFVTPVSRPQGITAGSDGALWFTNAGSNSIGRISAGGKATRFRHASIDKPQWITAGPDGALWFTNEGSDSIPAVGRCEVPLVMHIGRPALAALVLDETVLVEAA